MNLANVEMEKLVAAVVKEVLKSSGTSSPNAYGVFDCIVRAVEDASLAQKQLMTFSLEKRAEFITAMREAALAHAEFLAEMAVKETGMGRVADKIIKNRLAALKTPGTEDLKTEAYTGDRGLTIVEMAPFGVIGAITPVTNPAATIINNSIGMIAAGNSVVFCPHPSARDTSLKTVEILNKAIISRGGPQDILCTIKEPSLKAVQELMNHPKVNLLVATGGPDVVRAVLSSGKKAIGAGAGNPPVVVDETADIEKAAKDIVDGGTFDNNLPCIAEKSIIVVGSVADLLLANMQKHGAYLIQGRHLRDLEKLVLQEKIVEPGKSKYVPSKQYVGKDARYILEKIGIRAGEEIRGIVALVEAHHPFVMVELMMPILPLVQVKNIDEAIALAVKVEHGNRHTAIMHSKNVDHMTRFAKAIQTTIFVKNAPSYAGIGVGGEGFTTFTIAGPTGEGLTSARTFTRQRRCVLVDALSIV
jgi:propionaldehyde dehydrogenase